MHHEENKNLPTTFLKCFDYVKNDLYFNNKSKTQEKLKIPCLNRQELKKL